MSLSDKVAQLYPQELGCFSFALCECQGHSGGILTCFHMGWTGYQVTNLIVRPDDEVVRYTKMLVNISIPLYYHTHYVYYSIIWKMMISGKIFLRKAPDVAAVSVS
jgi:hypothetical protein